MGARALGAVERAGRGERATEVAVALNFEKALRVLILRVDWGCAVATGWERLLHAGRLKSRFHGATNLNQ